MQNHLPVQWRKTDLSFILGIIGAILLYFHEILTLQTGFYSGDHRQQHYPWAFFYAAQLKQGMLPWWTSLFGCGFPLLAEGQVGALYLPNFLFYKFFPFDFAYTYNILAHYILGGMFFYLLVRSRGLSSFSAFIGCLIYLFGTAQGGYYYNIISLKTLIWFPLALYFIFCIFEEQKYKFFFWLALIFAFQFCAGYLQYAVYSVAFCGVTCLWLAIFKIQAGKAKDAAAGLAAAFAAVVLGVLCAMPQLGATWELSRFSNRFDFPVEFAFVGSVNPLAIATLFFPHWDGFLRAELYFGALGLLFLMHAFRRSELAGRSYFIFCFFMAIALALGGFNPIYRWAVEWTGFSSFRIPAKFLYFAGFYGAVLCAYGAEAWFKQGEESHRKTRRVWSFLLAIAGFGLAVSHYFMQIFRKPLLSYFSDYIHKNYADSVIRPHSMDVYQQKLIVFYDGMMRVTQPWARENLIFLAFILLSWGLVTLAIKQKWPKQMVMICMTTILFANLWAFGNTSIRGNYEPKEFLMPASQVTDYLKSQAVVATRLHRVFRDIYGAAVLPLMPHNTALIGQSLVGVYSPLVLKSYYEFLGDLGDANDSNTTKVSTREQFLNASEKIDFLNVGWILSDHEFSFDRYQKVAEDENAFLYRNPHAKLRAYLERHENQLVAVDDKQNMVQINFKSDQADEMVMSDIFYPGWKAELNGMPAVIQPHDGLFRKVRIPGAGDWRLEMRYEPEWRKWLVPSMILAAFLLLAPFLIWRRNEK